MSNGVTTIHTLMAWTQIEALHWKEEADESNDVAEDCCMVEMDAISCNPRAPCPSSSVALK